MANLNKVMLIGNLTRDPEIRYTAGGTAVAEISLALNRVWNNEAGQKQEETTFVEVTFWGKTAELAHKYLAKGRPLYVEGRLQLDSWEDKQTGKKRSKLKVVGETLQFISDGKSRGESAASPPPQSRPAAAASPPAAAEDIDEDIPF